MIQSYSEAACAIDIHNHLRQDGLALERTVGTHQWWFRCTIIGFIEVDELKRTVTSINMQLHHLQCVVLYLILFHLI